MLRRILLAADVVLIVVAALLGLRVYDAWRVAPATTPTAPAGAGRVEPPAARPAAPPARSPLPAFAVVAERNLFSPNRSEVPPEPPRPVTAAPAAPPPPKPRLYGIVVLPDGKARAYLEDVQRRRVFAYSVGDSVAESRVEQIQADRVVLRRESEVYEVMLRDPTKPKVVAPAVAALIPGRAPGPASPPGAAGLPGPAGIAPRVLRPGGPPADGSAPAAQLRRPRPVRTPRRPFTPPAAPAPDPAPQEELAPDETLTAPTDEDSE